MAREYKAIKQMEDEIEHLRDQGYSHREIGEKLGYSKEQIKEFLRRERRQLQRQSEQVPQHRGRPRKHTTKSVTELEKENKQLKMENDLLRDFLKRTERK